MSFSFRYVNNLCIAERESPFKATPGQFYIIDGRFYSVAKSDGNKVSFIAKKGSHLDGFVNEEYPFVGPSGNGFQSIDTNDPVIVIAGGTGIGAALSIIQARDKKQETHLLFYNRDEPCYDQLIKELEIDPHLCTRMQVNTKNGRPVKPLNPILFRCDWHYRFEKSHIFVIGPKSLVDATREHAKELDVPNANFHLNF